LIILFQNRARKASVILARARARGRHHASICPIGSSLISQHSPHHVETNFRLKNCSTLDVSVAGLTIFMQYLAEEAERARRLAATSHDTELTRELTCYAAELERALAFHRRPDHEDETFVL
jgi:hypothetical protein